MDEVLRRQLVKKIEATFDNDDALPVVSLAEFFDGNTDEQSIGVNLVPEVHPGLAAFRRVLEGIRHRPEVQEVFVEIHETPDVDDPEDDGIWPTATVAFIVTSAPLPEVKSWVAPLRPRGVSEGWCVKAGIRVPLPDSKIRPGMRPVRVWLL